MTLPQLLRIVAELRKLQRYTHALEILTWTEEQGSFEISAADCAIRLELIIRVHGLAEAESYFEGIRDHSSQKTACLPLLHSYVKERNNERAETLMSKLMNLGLAVNPHPFNEMMKLYMATDQFEKVPLVIQQMKRDKIPLNVLSYNLWLGACDRISGILSAERVYKEMIDDVNVGVGWSTDCTLANMYIRAGVNNKALKALRIAEQKLSTRNRVGYFFLITLYAALNDRDGVLRLWEASKQVSGRITCANYMCILSCLVKLGDIGEAKRVFREWESDCRNYDIRVSNVLLGAYMRRGRMEEAESLHHHTLDRGGHPNYKTWEILMEGWLKNKQMDKAVEAMKKGFAMLKGCNWRPPPSIVTAIAEYFGEQGRVEDTRKYVKILRRLNLMSLPVYKSLLRAHIYSHRPAPDVLEMMEGDNIEWDEETRTLVQCISEMNGGATAL